MDSDDAHVYGDPVLVVELLSEESLPTGRNTFPNFSHDLKTLLNAESENFVDLCFHSDILNLLARFEQALVSSA